MKQLNPVQRLAKAGPSGWLIGLIVCGLAVSACRGNKSSSPPVHPQLNMDFQQKYTAQDRNAWFADNRSARPPVKGTVARGQLMADSAMHFGRGDDGRLLDRLPKDLELHEGLLARGEARYNIYCSICHEKSGGGNGVITQRGLLVAPPAFTDPRLQAMPLGYFFDVITNGKGTMKSYAAQVSVEDRWAIAAWVRTLQIAGRARLADVPSQHRSGLKRGTP